MACPNSQLRTAQARTERVTLQQLDPDATEDSHGMKSDTWEAIGTRWAKVTPKSSTEGQTANQTVARTTVEFDMPYDSVTSALTGKDRIVHRSKTYGITAVLNQDMRNETIVVTGVLSE